MNDYNITIAIKNKVPILVSGPRYLVCDNSDYTLTLETDEEWAAYATKTVLVVLPGGSAYAVLTSGDKCTLPILPRPGEIRIGVQAGELHTSMDLPYAVKRSIATIAGEEATEIPPDLAQQIITRLDALEESGVPQDKVEAAVEKYLTENPVKGTDFTPGNALELTDAGVLNVRTTSDMEEDNTLPITSAGVYTVVGNINALLNTI